MNTPSTLKWSALLAELRQTPERLRELTAAVDPAVVCRHAAPDQWAICDILAHLCAVESPYRARLVRIAIEDNPRVTAIGPVTGDYDPETPVSILLDTFSRLRSDTIGFLRSLPVDGRARSAIHAELGPITLRGQAEALLAHDEKHLAQVTALLGRWSDHS